jgi:hypothetical protein
VTATVSVCTAAVAQSAVALGPYKLNVIVPVGVDPPERVAVSVTAVPSVPPGLGRVARAGEALALAPFRIRLAVAAGLVPVAVSVPVSLWPAVVGA